LKKSYKTSTEAQILVNALCLINGPKLNDADYIIFKGIINDMFPGL
jgi:hypothetical protein